jgi:hypothetical protein
MCRQGLPPAIAARGIVRFLASYCLRQQRANSHFMLQVFKGVWLSAPRYHLLIVARLVQCWQRGRRLWVFVCFS